MKFEFLKVNDPSDKIYKEKKIIWDLPFRVALISKSQHGLGKTTVILNLLLRDKFYGKDFEGEDIYIISNNKVDKKLSLLMEEKDIPSSNFMSFDEAKLEALYEILEDDFLDEKKKRNRLIIFDDVAYSSDLKNNNSIISKIVMNGRHINLSSLFTSQKYSLLSTGLRSNLTGAMIGNLSNKELDLVAEDYNFLPSGKKSEFIKKFREVVKDKRDALIINFTNTPEEGLYLDKNFNKVFT